MAISSYDATAANNTTLGGIDLSGTTGKVKDGDNVMRQMAADMKNGLITGYTTTATAAGTTTLTVASNSYQYFTGSTTQTITMPVTSTLELGRTFVIVNNSTGALTVNSSGGNLIETVNSGDVVTVRCILVTGTSAASWAYNSPRTITSNDAGATVGPVLVINRASATPAASDIIGRLSFAGQDSDATIDRYGTIETVILDPTATSEDGAIDIYAITAGNQVQIARFGPSAILRGTATNDNPSAGFVGQLIESTVTSGSAVSLTTATDANVTSISLTAGDWDVSATIGYVPGATTNITRLIQSISQTSATIDSATGGALTSDIFVGGVVMGTSNLSYRRSIGPIRISLAATTTIYLVAQATFTVSTLAAFGHLFARRRR